MAGEGGLSATIHRDAGAAIVAISFLDYWLGQSIQWRLTNIRTDAVEALFDEYKPLYTLDAKISMGMALELYGEETKTILEAIKHVRNTFAHAPMRLSFETPQIKEACEAIKLYRELAKLVGKPRTVRMRFLRTTQCLGMLITSRASRLEAMPLRHREAFVEKPAAIWRAPLP